MHARPWWKTILQYLDTFVRQFNKISLVANVEKGGHFTWRSSCRVSWEETSVPPRRRCNLFPSLSRLQHPRWWWPLSLFLLLPGASSSTSLSSSAPGASEWHVRVVRVKGANDVYRIPFSPATKPQVPRLPPPYTSDMFHFTEDDDNPGEQNGYQESQSPRHL